jgi:ubiquinone/menaquinone biosynthesis C-methylase UbiE
MSIQAAYDDWAATYDLDRNLTRDLDQVVTRKTLAHRRCRSILEIGCGTGKNTPLLADISEKVLALDFSQAMINRAKEKLPLDHVSFAVADLTYSWPCDDQSVDLIVCNLVLEHIDDLSFIFSEAFRALMTGGHFFICELHPFRQYQGIKANFKRDQGTTVIPAFVHHISEFIHTAHSNGLTIESLNEWWHEDDQDKLPRLVSFLFKK